jgi:hypothetical protein
MQFLRAGEQQLILLELESELLGGLAKQAGFECTFEEDSRRILAELSPSGWKDPLLLFDAADPANIGWFSRCQFYVDGRTGAVLQTPLMIANCKDREGRVLQSLRVAISKELPAGFQVPGQQTVSEQVVYGLFFNLLKSLRTTGVAVCGGPVVTPLVGRAERVGTRN